MATCKRRLGARCHIEMARGDAASNRRYCTKDGDPLCEVGTIPEPGRRSDLGEIKDLLDAGTSAAEIASTHFPAWCQYRRAFTDYQQAMEPQRRYSRQILIPYLFITRQLSWRTNVFFLWGPTGAGKSRYVNERSAVPLGYQSNGGFILGYNGEDVVVFEETDPADFPRDFLLRLLDRYPLRVNIKGGDRNWKPRTIYFTSNNDPTAWLQNDAALWRRVTEVRQFPDWLSANDYEFEVNSLNGSCSE